MQINTLKSVEETFRTFVVEADGEVSDCCNDGSRLYLRSILNQHSEVGPQDPVAGGVALFCDGDNVEVRPYIFRVVCENGAIMPRCADATVIGLATCTHGTLHDALVAAASLKDFKQSAGEIKDLATRNFDLALMMHSVMGRHPDLLGPAAVLDIFERFRADGGRSAFHFMNAITSRARDTSDPDEKWKLEELGGMMPALIASAPRTRTDSDALDWPFYSLEVEELQKA